MRSMLVAVIFAFAAAGCAGGQAAPPSAAPSHTELLQQQLVQLTWLNASLQHALEERDTQLRRMQRTAPDIERLRTLVAINDELMARLDATQTALRDAGMSEHERLVLAGDLARARNACGDDWSHQEKLPVLVDQLQRRLDSGLVRVRMHDGRVQLVVQPSPLPLVKDPWDTNL